MVSVVLEEFLESLDVKVSGNTVYHDGSYITLDKRSYVGYELGSNIGAFLGDPLSGNESLIVSDLVNILNLGTCLIRIVGKSLEDYHLS